MSCDGEVLAVEIEVGIRGEDAQTMAHRHGADEEVGRATLHPAPATEVVVAGGVLVVLLVQREVGIESKVFPKLSEAILGFRAAKQFSPNGPKHLDDVSADQACEFTRDWVVLGPIASKKL